MTSYSQVATLPAASFDTTPKDPRWALVDAMLAVLFAGGVQSYDPTISGLTATTVKTAIDELKAYIDARLS